MTDQGNDDTRSKTISPERYISDTEKFIQRVQKITGLPMADLQEVIPATEMSDEVGRHLGEEWTNLEKRNEHRQVRAPANIPRMGVTFRDGLKYGNLHASKSHGTKNKACVEQICSCEDCFESQNEVYGLEHSRFSDKECYFVARKNPKDLGRFCETFSAALTNTELQKLSIHLYRNPRNTSPTVAEFQKSVHMLRRTSVPCELRKMFKTGLIERVPDGTYRYNGLVRLLEEAGIKAVSDRVLTSQRIPHRSIPLREAAAQARRRPFVSLLAENNSRTVHAGTKSHTTRSSEDARCGGVTHINIDGTLGGLGGGRGGGPYEGTFETVSGDLTDCVNDAKEVFRDGSSTASGSVICTGDRGDNRADVVSGNRGNEGGNDSNDHVCDSRCDGHEIDDIASYGRGSSDIRGGRHDGDNYCAGGSDSDSDGGGYGGGNNGGSGDEGSGCGSGGSGGIGGGSIGGGSIGGGNIDGGSDGGGDNQGDHRGSRPDNGCRNDRVRGSGSVGYGRGDRGPVQTGVEHDENRGHGNVTNGDTENYYQQDLFIYPDFDAADNSNGREDGSASYFCGNGQMSENNEFHCPEMLIYPKSPTADIGKTRQNSPASSTCGVTTPSRRGSHHQLFDGNYSKSADCSVESGSITLHAKNCSAGSSSTSLSEFTKLLSIHPSEGRSDKNTRRAVDEYDEERGHDNDTSNDSEQSYYQELHVFPDVNTTDIENIRDTCSASSAYGVTRPSPSDFYHLSGGDHSPSADGSPETVGVDLREQLSAISSGRSSRDRYTSTIYRKVRQHSQNWSPVSKGTFLAKFTVGADRGDRETGRTGAEKYDEDRGCGNEATDGSAKPNDREQHELPDVKTTAIDNTRYTGSPSSSSGNDNRSVSEECHYPVLPTDHDNIADDLEKIRQNSSASSSHGVTAPLPKGFHHLSHRNYSQSESGTAETVAGNMSSTLTLEVAETVAVRNIGHNTAISRNAHQHSENCSAGSSSASLAECQQGKTHSTDNLTLPVTLCVTFRATFPIEHLDSLSMASPGLFLSDEDYAALEAMQRESPGLDTTRVGD